MSSSAATEDPDACADVWTSMWRRGAAVVVSSVVVPVIVAVCTLVGDDVLVLAADVVAYVVLLRIVVSKDCFQRAEDSEMS